MSSLGLYFHTRFEEQKKICNTKLINNNFIKPKSKKIRCGISWLSESGLTKQKKSINIDQFKEIFSLTGVEFINLQYTNEKKSIIELEKQINKNIFFDHSIDCFNDILGLANLIKSCDLVITVSNSNAHIAGRLGVKTYLLIPKNAGQFWYWNDDQSKSFFYPSIQYFKQKKLNDWKEPLQAIFAELNKLIANFDH